MNNLNQGLKQKCRGQDRILSPLRGLTTSIYPYSIIISTLQVSKIELLIGKNNWNMRRN
jgi:hypothetical protein